MVDQRLIQRDEDAREILVDLRQLCQARTDAIAQLVGVDRGEIEPVLKTLCFPEGVTG